MPRSTTSDAKPTSEFDNSEPATFNLHDFLSINHEESGKLRSDFGYNLISN